MVLREEQSRATHGWKTKETNVCAQPWLTCQPPSPCPAPSPSRESLGQRDKGLRLSPLYGISYRNQPWIFTGRTDAEAEALILWPPDGNSRLIGKDPDGRKDWRQKEKGAVEDKMVRQHQQLNIHEFEKTPGDGEGQGSLGCCNPQGSQRVRHDLATEQHRWGKEPKKSGCMCITESLCCTPKTNTTL